MAVTYDQPTSTTDYDDAVQADDSLDQETKDAIEQAVSGDETVDIAAGAVDSATGEINVTAPASGGIDVALINTGTDANQTVTAAIGADNPLQNAAVLQFQGSASVHVTVDDAGTTGPGRVATFGRGNDHFTTTGTRNNTVSAGDGDDSVSTAGGNDSVSGGAGNDTLGTGDGNDSVGAGEGQDSVDGGAGFDYMSVDFAGGAPAGAQASAGDPLAAATVSYSVTQGSDGTVIVSDGAGNQVQFANIEFVQFSNGESLTATDNIDQAAAMRLYQTVLGRSADAAGADFYMDEAVTATNPADVIAAGMLGSDEFTAKYGAIDSLTNQQFVELMYTQGLGRASDQAGFDFYVSELEAGETRNQVAAEINASAESTEVNIDTVLLLDQDSNWV